MIDSGFTGWFLFAFDHRIATPVLIAEPGYGSPAVIPTLTLTGGTLVGVARRHLHPGRLNVALQVGAGPELTGHTHLR